MKKEGLRQSYEEDNNNLIKDVSIVLQEQLPCVVAQIWSIIMPEELCRVQN